MWRRIVIYEPARVFEQKTQIKRRIYSQFLSTMFSKSCKMESAQQSAKNIMSNCQYNMTKQLEKKLQFLWNVDGYIQDAEKEGNMECAKVFKEIKADEERHASALKELLATSTKHQSR